MASNVTIHNVLDTNVVDVITIDSLISSNWEDVYGVVHDIAIWIFGRNTGDINIIRNTITQAKQVFHDTFIEDVKDEIDMVGDIFLNAILVVADEVGTITLDGEAVKVLDIPADVVHIIEEVI